VPDSPRGDSPSQPARADRYRTLFEHLPVGIYQTTPAGEFIDANPTLVEMLGYESWDELKHVNTVDLYVNPADRLAWRAAMERDGKVTDFEVRKRRKDGRVVWLRDNARVVRGPDGEVLWYEGAIIDVTDQRLAEQRSRALLDATPDCMLRFGSDGLCIDADVDKPDADALSSREPRGLRASDIFPQDAVEMVEAAIRVATERREVAVCEYAKETGEGASATYEVRSLPCGVGDALVLVRDVTEQREMQAAIVHSERMASVGLLAAGVAHEINNPLSYLSSNVEFVARFLEDHAETLSLGQRDLVERLEESQRALAEALGGISRVAHIVRDLRTFSRPELGVSSHADAAVALETAIAIVSNEIRHRARLERNIGTRAMVAAGPQRLVQVFVNLLLNAAQSIPEGDTESHRIGVSLGELDPETVEVVITDTGPGIAPADLKRIFQPFFTTKSLGRGTGLGLSVCQAIVSQVGGRIDVTSVLGEGTTFRVRLPRLKGATQTISSEPPPLRPTSGRSRVLIIDDEPLVARSIERTLRDIYETATTQDAREALEWIRSGVEVDAVLCDVMMPGMSGMEFHAELSKTHGALAKRVVFITGGAFTPMAEQFLEALGTPVMDKPIDSRRLRDALAKTIRGEDLSE